MSVRDILTNLSFGRAAHDLLLYIAVLNDL